MNRGFLGENMSQPVDKKIKIQLYRSVICTPKTHKIMVSTLGLHKLNQIVTHPDLPSIRGVVAKVPHLLRVLED